MLISIIVIFGFYQFFAFTYGTPPLPRTTLQVNSEWVYLFPQKGQPVKEDWKYRDVMRIIERTRTSEETTRVDLVPYLYIVQSPLSYYSILYEIPLRVEWYRGGTDADYVLTLKDREGFWGWGDENREMRFKAQDLFEQNIDHYILIETLRLPDESELLIYQRR